MPSLSMPPAGAFRRLAKMTETFLAEVGVLLFVFPVLDQYVQHGQRAMTWQLFAGSLFASLCCYGGAAILAIYILKIERF